MDSFKLRENSLSFESTLSGAGHPIGGSRREAQAPSPGVAAPRNRIHSSYTLYSARIDGFIGIPSAALAFQWSTRARYYFDLRVGYVLGCLVVSQAAFDPLPMEAQQAVRSAAAMLMRHMEDMGEQQDDALIHSLFEKQGMHREDVPSSFRANFLEAARTARLALGGSLTTQALLDSINGWLADYRSDHR